jgi:uncharacterized membrane protein
LQESVTPAHHAALEVVVQSAEWIRIALEGIGAIIIAVGAIVASAHLLGAALSRRHASFNAIRLGFARYLALALEFQLAADILETAIAPEWPKIGELAAIATIRTALNYFLSREMREEREQAAASTLRGGKTRDAEDSRGQGDHRSREQQQPHPA